MTIPRTTRQSFQIVLDSLTSLVNTLTEIGQEQLLNSICFESMTTLGVECFFKGMRADHDMPTVIGYAYRRARCVEDDMLCIYQKHFSHFTGPNSYNPEKIIKSDPPDITSRANKQARICEGTGNKEEDKRREDTMRDFVREYGRGVRQDNVRSKTKEQTGTLPYALSMRPTVITASLEEDHDITAACQTVDACDEMGGRNVRVQVIYQEEDVVAVRHNRRREVSPYWLAILLEDVQVKANGGNFLRDKVPLRWLNQTEDILTYTSGDVCDQNSPKCILASVLDFTCEKSGNVLTVNVSPEEDIRLSRIANGDVGEGEDDSENENKAEMPNHDDHHEVTGQSLPPRLEGVSLSGRRTTRFVLG